MIKKLTIDDKDILNRIVSHPDVYPHIIDDYADNSLVDQYGELLLKAGFPIISDCEGIAFILMPRSHTVFDVHTIILPESRGRKAIDTAKEIARFVFENTTCKKINSEIRVGDRATMLFALRVGFKKQGINTKSFLLNGELLDQYVVGLERSQICQLGQ